MRRCDIAVKQISPRVSGDFLQKAARYVLEDFRKGKSLSLLSSQNGGKHSDRDHSAYF